MIIGLDIQGNIINRIPENIYQGSSNANKIEVLAPFSSSLLMKCEILSPKLIVNEFIVSSKGEISNGVNLWEVDITEPVTQFYGQARGQVKFYEQEKIIASASFDFEIKKGFENELPPEPTPDIYEQIINIITDINGKFVNKADLVQNATEGNFAGLDAYGNLVDSGNKASDFATAEQGIKADNSVLFVEQELSEEEKKQARLNIGVTGVGLVDYSEIANKPTLNGVEINGDLTNSDLGIPTKTSQLENDGDGISVFATEDFVFQNGGKIDTISLNGEELPITDKKVNIENVAKTNQNNNFSTGQTITGTLTVEGDIVQNGEAYETHAEQLFTKNDIIITRDGAVGGLTDSQYTGIVASKYDGANDGALIYDNDGIARVGDITRDEQGNITSVEDTQPLATREEAPIDNGVARWNATNKRFETFDIDPLFDAKMDKEGTKLVYNDLNELPSSPYITIIANTNTTVNGPVSDSGVVIQKTASSSYKTQLFIANDVNTTTWRRNYRNGVWGEWKQIANTDGKYSSLISGGNVVIDTRNIDSPPSYYKNQQVCYEFKTASVIGLDTYMPGSTFVTLKSVKGWVGSGYLVYQEAVSANNNLGAIGDGTICFRYGNNETWGEWNKITTQSLAEREMGMLLPRGTKVEQDSDINSIEYIKIGNYYCSANSTASTIQNLPEPTAFMMQVMSPLSTTYDNEETSTWVYRLRILTTYTGTVYYQYVSSGATAGVFGYGAWKKVIKSDDKLLTNKMDGFNSSFSTNQTGWIRLAEINDAYSPIILVLGGGYYTSQPSDGIFAISKTYDSSPIITQLVGRKKSWWDKIRIVYGESKQYIELNKTNTSNENIRFTLICDGPTGSNITINKRFVAGAIPDGYSSVEHTIIDGTVFQDLYVKGQQELDGYLKIKGTAAERHLITRGIGGCDETAQEDDDLYLNYGTDYGVRFGKTGQGKLMPDGKINTTGLTDGTNSISVANIMTKANFVLDGTTLNITTT